MLAWLSQNIATILICLVLTLIVGGAIAVIIRDRKKGRSSCGCDCGSCPGCGSCGAKQ